MCQTQRLGPGSLLGQNTVKGANQISKGQNKPPIRVYYRGNIFFGRQCTPVHSDNGPGALRVSCSYVTTGDLSRGQHHLSVST